MRKHDFVSPKNMFGQKKQLQDIEQPHVAAWKYHVIRRLRNYDTERLSSKIFTKKTRSRFGSMQRTNIFYRLLLKMPNMPLQATGYLALVAFVKLTSKLVSLTHC